MKPPYYVLVGLLAAACTSTRPPLPLDAPKETETVAAAVPVEPGVSRLLARQRRQQLSGLGYALQLTVPADKQTDIQATEIIRFRLKSTAQPLQLDFKEQAGRLQRLLVNGRPVPIDHQQEHLIIPAAALRVGANEIGIEFRAGNLSLNRNDEYLYTLLVPDRARTVFPVFDQPDLKASFQLTLSVPESWQALANAPLKSAGPSSSVPGAETYSFAPSDTISTYLFSFVAGRFQTAESHATDGPVAGRNLRLLHRETDPDKLRLSLPDIFRLHRDALTFMEQYTSLPYPFRKLDFAALPDFQYGGMEHVGAIDYKASTLFLDAGATQDQLLARSSLISHETAHMWFGDLVTMRWFDDVWMKEVFANFMADKITQAAIPGASYDLKFVVDHFPAAYAVDRTAGANAIRQPLDNLKDAGSLYGNIIYHKAPIMMRQLERLMGEDAFRDGLREYLRTYAHGNATWPDLIRLLDARTPADLQAWNQVWVNQPGRPVFDYQLNINPDGNISLLEISQKAEDGSNRLWPQLFEVLLVYGDGRTKELTVNMNQAQVMVPEAAGLPAPRFVLFNATGLGYGVFPVDDQLGVERKASYKELGQVLGYRLAQLPNPVARAASYVNLYENVLNRRYLPPRALLDVYRQRLLHERDELSLKLLTGQLTDLYWKFLTPAQRTALAPVLEQELWYALEQNPAPNQKKLLFRAYQSVALSRAAQQRLYQVWERQQPPTGVKLTEDDYTALALALAVRDYPASDPILPRQLARIQNPDRQQRLRFLMPALSPEPATRDQFFAGLADQRNREKEAWVVAALGYLHHPLRVAASEKYLPQSLALLEEIQQTGDIFFPYSWLQATLGYYQTPSAAGTVRDFLARHPQLNPKLRAKLQQAADDLLRAEQLVAQ